MRPLERSNASTREIDGEHGDQYPRAEAHDEPDRALREVVARAAITAPTTSDELATSDQSAASIIGSPEADAGER